MNCYQCGSKLGSGRYCLRCGADVSVYRKIIHISNNYYNAGLEKARLRDLSGAAEALSKSLQYDKKNIDARNLLGLVYYEMGEVVEALSQWVISKNFKATDNLADEYLMQLQEDRNQLETMNQAIKKFNQALSHAKNDGIDLAMVQLKRVIKQHPHFIKAYQLLALLYIEDEDYSRANRLLKRALKIDRGNTLCLKYSRLIRGKLGKNRSSKEKYQEEKTQKALLSVEESASADVIVPEYRERSGGTRVALGVLAGFAAAVCLIQFVIVPTVRRNTNVEVNEAVASYATKLADKELEIQTLTTQMEELQAEMDTLNETLDTYTDDSEGVLSQYDALLTAVNLYMDADTEKADLAKAFASIETDAVDSTAFDTVYESLQQYVTEDMVTEVFNEGLERYNEYYYSDAIELFEECLSLNADYDPAMYYLGLCYERRDDDETALTYYQQIVDDYPDSEYYDEAQAKTESLGEE